MRRTLVRITIILILSLIFTSCSLFSRTKRAMGGTAWVKAGQCSALVWDTYSSLACPVSRVGSDLINVLIIPDRNRDQQNVINRLGTSQRFSMEFVVYKNPNDSAGLVGIVPTLDVDTSNYLLPITLDGQRR